MNTRKEKTMDINIEQLRAVFEPFDLLHLLRLYIVLTIFIFLWGLLTTTSGIYPTARQFWKVHLIVLGSAYALSGICFLLLHVDPLLLMLGELALAFIIQGHLGTEYQETSREDWWAFRLYWRQRAEEEERERQE